MRPLSLCTGEQPLVPPSSNFIFSCTNLTTRNAIELATLASFLTITHCTVSKERHRIGNTGKFSHHHPLHCLQGLFVLPTSELGQKKTQMGKVKEERKTPLFKVLSYLDNTAQALLRITPDRCFINLGKREL